MLFLKSNAFHRSFPLYLFLVFLLFLFFFPPFIFAQVSGKEKSNAGIKDLGRRRKIEDETFVVAALMAMCHPQVNCSIWCTKCVVCHDSTFDSISRKLTNCVAAVVYGFLLEFRTPRPSSVVGENEIPRTKTQVVEVSTSKIGKHGHAKCDFVAIDIFTVKKLEDIVPSSHNFDVPRVNRTDYQLIDISEDGFLKNYQLTGLVMAVEASKVSAFRKQLNLLIDKE